MNDFERKMIDDCHARLREIDNEKEQIQFFMKCLGYKKPRRSRYKPRLQGEAMAELDAHRRTRLSIVTTTPLTRDESRKLVAGDVSVAGQT